MTAYSNREVDKIIELRAKWTEYEHDSWKLISFSQKTARFGWDYNGQFTKYVEIGRVQIDFILGVQPDVLDNF